MSVNTVLIFAQPAKPIASTMLLYAQIAANAIIAVICMHSIIMINTTIGIPVIAAGYMIFKVIIGAIGL